MTLLGIELGTLEVKGEWSDHYTTEAPCIFSVPQTRFVLRKIITSNDSMFCFGNLRKVHKATADSVNVAGLLVGNTPTKVWLRRKKLA